MAMTRSQRAWEVRTRCTRAVNLLAYMTLSGGDHRYIAGRISPDERELLVWLIGFIVISATQAGPPVGPWVDQESLALTELFDDPWMENVGPYLPPKLKKFLCLFRTGQLTRGDKRLIGACQEQTSPREVLMHVGFRYVEGGTTFHMVGRGIVVAEA